MIEQEVHDGVVLAFAALSLLVAGWCFKSLLKGEQ